MTGVQTLSLPISELIAGNEIVERDLATGQRVVHHPHLAANDEIDLAAVALPIDNQLVRFEMPENAAFLQLGEIPVGQIGQDLDAGERRPLGLGHAEIGRASGRARVCQYVYVSGVAVLLKKKRKKNKA